MSPNFDSAYILELMAGLEREYSLRPRHPEREAIYADYAARSLTVRSASPRWQCLRYAEPERCAIDWFPAEAPRPGRGTPLLIFIHGGFWRALDRDQFSFIAEHYVRAGVSVAMIDYELAPQVSVATIVDQSMAALRWLNEHASDLGFDPLRVSISGHSAGGHLAAMLASTDPSGFAGQPFVANIPISGLFALEPLLLTSINLDIRLTPQEAVQLSPIRRSRFYCGHFLVVVGGYETDGFIGQSRDFHQALIDNGVGSALEIVPERTHFDILEDFAQPGQPLFQKVLALVTGDPTRSEGT